MAADPVKEIYLTCKGGDWSRFLDAAENNPQLAGLCARFVNSGSRWTFLHQAAYWNNARACYELIRYGASLLTRAPEGGIPADVAAQRGYNDLAADLKAASLSSCWAPVPDPTLMASSSLWSQANQKPATHDMVVAYGGGTVDIPRGARYFADKYGRVLVGWHGTWNPPCGMDGEPMVTRNGRY
ncbi:putative Ankyrin repeat [Paratrimastix pyriformis]|uniref:Ankyrin repeat n=1 Tax=Paratrimastix pyriformis TaxID=342808 RepID=A0ABQ8UB26_9EUKA|nr:putative Ankyrin repeat [Paratrimastix pyriformis]